MPTAKLVTIQKNFTQQGFGNILDKSVGEQRLHWHFILTLSTIFFHEFCINFMLPTANFEAMSFLLTSKMTEWLM